MNTQNLKKPTENIKYIELPKIPKELKNIIVKRLLHSNFYFWLITLINTFENQPIYYKSINTEFLYYFFLVILVVWQQAIQQSNLVVLFNNYIAQM